MLTVLILFLLATYSIYIHISYISKLKALEEKFDKRIFSNSVNLNACRRQFDKVIKYLDKDKS